MKITMEQIKKNLKEAIDQSGMSQSEIAKKLGINQSNISDYVRGKKAPALDTLANLCAILDVDPADILCIDELNKRQ